MYVCTAGVDALQAEQPEAEKAAEEKEEVVVRNDSAVDHEWLDAEPPVGILKKSSYVSGEESGAEHVPPPTDDSKREEKKGRKGRRKLVPVWRLVSCFYGRILLTRNS